jgi:hypothetical protein
LPDPGICLPLCLIERMTYQFRFYIELIWLSRQGHILVVVWLFAEIGLFTLQALEHFSARFISSTLFCS